MDVKYAYYVLPEDREQMQKNAIREAAISIGGPIGMHESLVDEVPSFIVPDDFLRVSRDFCKLLWEDKQKEAMCFRDYEEKAISSHEPQIGVCWCGVYNLFCPVKDKYGSKVTLFGGEFRLAERKGDSDKLLKNLLADFGSEQQDKFREAWYRIPKIDEMEAGYKLRELSLIGRNYVYALKRQSDFRRSANSAAHDVLIALQPVISDIEKLKSDLKSAFNIGEKWEKRLDAIAKRCEDQIADLDTRLGLSKPKYEYDSIGKLIHECVDLYAAKAKECEIYFQVDLEREIDEEGKYKVVAVRMDRAALKRALVNIIDNAVKYSFSGSATHPRRVEILGRRQTMRGLPGYNIAVSNLGIGIEKDEIDLVFEPGYQGRRRLDEDRPGYGVGLSFVKDCIERHEGKIVISSQSQQRTGWLTVVSVWLPIQGPSKQ